MIHSFQYLNENVLNRIYQNVILEKRKKQTNSEIRTIGKKDACTLTDRSIQTNSRKIQISRLSNVIQNVSKPKLMKKPENATRVVKNIKRKQINPSPTLEHLLERLSFHKKGIISMLDEVM